MQPEKVEVIHRHIIHYACGCTTTRIEVQRANPEKILRCAGHLQDAIKEEHTTEYRALRRQLETKKKRLPVRIALRPETMTTLTFQDQYLDARADCWGCGRNNPDGLYIKSHWEGEEAVAHFLPKPQHTGHKGVVNGGIIATLMDCHCMGLAMAHAHKQEGREIGTQPLITYVTASLKVDYLKPTPLTEQPLELRARVERIEGRKTWMKVSLFASGQETVRGEVLGVRINEPPDLSAL